MKVFIDASLLIYLSAVTEPETSRKIGTFYLDFLKIIGSVQTSSCSR